VDLLLGWSVERSMKVQRRDTFLGDAGRWSRAWD
jgi:hypothetical protein